MTVRNSSFHDARGGHEFKSRCRRTTILDSSFLSTRSSRNIDIPDGGETFIYNTLLSKSLGANSVEFVAFAAESCRHRGVMHLRRVRIVNRNPRGAITNFDKCLGQPIVIEEATFEGYRPQLNGGVLLRDQPGSPAIPPSDAERLPGRGQVQPLLEDRRLAPSRSRSPMDGGPHRYAALHDRPQPSGQPILAWTETSTLMQINRTRRVGPHPVTKRVPGRPGGEQGRGKWREI